MAAEAVFVLFALALAVGAPVVLWLLIEGETSGEQVLDRESAEQLAREEYERERDGGRNRPR